MRRPWAHAALCLPLIAACGGGAAKPAEVPSPRAATSAPISAADLRTRISIFAADSMQGRRTGTPGNVKGNAYIASEVARLGLRPAGDSGKFLQQLPLTSYAIDPARATLRAGTNSLEVFKDYYAYQPTFDIPARSIEGAQLIFAGGIADTAKLPSRDELRGKLVVFRSDSKENTSLGAPDLSPNGRLGLISGIVITQIDPLIGTFEQQFRPPA